MRYIKTQKFLTLVLSILFIFELSNLPEVFAFGNRSHECLSVLAFRKERVFLERKGWLETQQNKREYNLALVMKGATLPDEVERGKFTAPYFWHFYNPYFDSKSANANKNAMTMMISHFDKAIIRAKNGKKEESLVELGMSLHYLQDLCCPVHIWGYDFNGHTTSWYGALDGHTAFHMAVEKRWDNLWYGKNFEDPRRLVENLDNDLGCDLPFDELSSFWIGKKAFDLTWKKYECWIRNLRNDSSFFDKLMKVNRWNIAGAITNNVILSLCATFGDFYDNDIFVIPYAASRNLVQLYIHRVLRT